MAAYEMQTDDQQGRFDLESTCGTGEPLDPNVHTKITHSLG